MYTLSLVDTLRSTAKGLDGSTIAGDGRYVPEIRSLWHRCAGLKNEHNTPLTLPLLGCLRTAAVTGIAVIGMRQDVTYGCAHPK